MEILKYKGGNIPIRGVWCVRGLIWHLLYTQDVIIYLCYHWVWWIMGDYGDCDQECGTGYQNRDVTCSSGNEEDCDSATKPSTIRECNTESCLGNNI